METAICTTIKSIARDQWEACRSSKGNGDPFLSYDFFSLLETSNSIGRNTGWAPFYIAFKEKNVVVGIIVRPSGKFLNKLLLLICFIKSVLNDIKAKGPL